MQSLQALVDRYGELPDTLTATTRNGGRHYVFKPVPGLRCSTSKIAPGLDVKAQGGYSAVEPSFVAPDAGSAGSGQYAWIDWDPLNDEMPVIAVAPDWLIEMASGPPPAQQGVGAASVREGGRNDYLSREAYRFRKQGRTVEAIEPVLQALNQEFCVPCLDPTEVARIAQGKAGIDSESAAPQRQPLFYALKDLLALRAPPCWLVRDFLEESVLAELYGEPGSAKSFAALDVGLCIAHGITWHGKSVATGAVFYIAGEGFGGVRRRIAAWCTEHAIAEGSFGPFFVSQRAIALCDESAVRAVEEEAEVLLARETPPRLVIVDTVARAFSGNENSTEDMCRFIAALDGLRAQLNCAILLVHHTGHGNADRARGSSALRAALDAEFAIKKDGNRVTIACTKMKDAEMRPPIALELHSVALPGWFDEDGATVTSAVLRIATEEQPLRKRKLSRDAALGEQTFIAAAIGQGTRANADPAVSLEQWRQAFYAKSTADGPNAKRAAFSRARRELTDEGIVCAEDDAYTLVLPNVNWAAELILSKDKIAASIANGANGSEHQPNGVLPPEDPRANEHEPLSLESVRRSVGSGGAKVTNEKVARAFEEFENAWWSSDPQHKEVQCLDGVPYVTKDALDRYWEEARGKRKGGPVAHIVRPLLHASGSYPSILSRVNGVTRDLRWRGSPGPIIAEREQGWVLTDAEIAADWMSRAEKRNGN